jgi:hypothetical protein
LQKEGTKTIIHAIELGAKKAGEFRDVPSIAFQRAGIADGGEFYIRPPEPLPGFLIKLNIKN